MLIVKRVNIPFASDTYLIFEKELKSHSNHKSFSINLSGEIGDTISALWADHGIQECFNRSFEIQVKFLVRLRIT